MRYRWPAKEAYPEDYPDLGPKLSFLSRKNPILRYALLKRLEYGLDVSLSDLSQDSVVLEVGAGAGFFFPEVANRSRILIDLDYSSSHRKAVKSMVKHEGIEHKVVLIEGDIHHLPFKEESFDLVYCFSVLEHVSLESVKELHRVLKRGGILVAGIPIETVFSKVGRIVFGIGGHKKGEVFHSFKVMENELSHFFTTEQFKRVPHNLMPGFCSLYDVLRLRKL